MLRSMRESDVDSTLIHWLTSPSINRFLEVRRVNVSIESQIQFIREKSESKSDFYFAILNLDLVMIGTASLSWDTVNGKATIGLMIGNASFWGKGLGTRVIETLCEFAFEDLQVRKVVAGIMKPNQASLGAFLKAGFLIEAELSQELVLADAEAVDVYRVCRFRNREG